MNVQSRGVPFIRSVGLALSRTIRSFDRVGFGIIFACMGVTTLSFIAHGGDRAGFIVDCTFAIVACGVSLVVFHGHRHL